MMYSIVQCQQELSSEDGNVGLTLSPVREKCDCFCALSEFVSLHDQGRIGSNERTPHYRGGAWKRRDVRNFWKVGNCFYRIEPDLFSGRYNEGDSGSAVGQAEIIQYPPLLSACREDGDGIGDGLAVNRGRNNVCVRR